MHHDDSIPHAPIRPKRIVHIYCPPLAISERVAVFAAEHFGYMPLTARVLNWLVRRHPDDASVVVDFEHISGPHPQTIQQMPDYHILKVNVRPKRTSV